MVSVFFDTNILAYAYDEQAGEKQLRAKAFLEPFLTQYKRGIISAQVLHELGYCFYRWKLNDTEVETAIAPFKHWKIIPNDLHVFEEGLRLKNQYQTSYWDGLILAAAIRSGAKELWSEDFSNGQVYEGVTIVNPLEA